MDPVGFAMGAISLAALFDACVNLADYIRLANNLGKDYETTFTKFLLLKSRLCAWGSCIQALQTTKSEGLDAEWSVEENLVYRSLTAIKAMLEDAQGLELRYGLRKEGHDVGQIGIPHQQQSPALEEVENSLKDAMKRRQRQASWSKKFVWAVRDKKAFESLINELAFHVNELEKIAVRMRMPISDAMKDSIQHITTPAAIQLLETACSEPDLGRAGSEQYTAGHVYVRNLVTQQAKAILGDIDMHGKSGRSHRYVGNQVVGDSRVVMGNISGEAMSQFWGL